MGFHPTKAVALKRKVRGNAYKFKVNGMHCLIKRSRCYLTLFDISIQRR